MSRQILADTLLLVEGRDEENLFGALIDRHLGADSEIQIIGSGGVDKFPVNLDAIRIAAQARPTLRSIGVVRDADDDADTAFRSVCDHLHNVGYLPPAAHGEFSDAIPSIGVFVVPDGSSTGALETLCRRSVGGTDAAGCVDEYIECLERRDAMQSRNTDKSFALPISLPCAILSRGSVKEREVACGTWSRQHSQHFLDFFATSPRRVPDRARTLPASWSFVRREEELRAALQPGHDMPALQAVAALGHNSDSRTLP